MSMQSRPKKILLLYTDKYYFIKQVYPFGLDLIAHHFRKYGYEVTIEREPKFNYAYEMGGMPVQVKRGCNRHCAYCVEPHLEGKKLVFKDLVAVIEELRFIARQYEGIRNIFFVDTEFNIPNLDYGSRLIRKIIELGLHERFRFSSQFLPSPFDSDFAKLLTEAGFSIILTCDSFSDIVLEKNRSSCRKKERINTLELCEKFSLDCTVNLIFGLPGETYETIDQTISLMMKYPPNAGRRYEYTFGGRIYQGTPLCRFVETRKSDLHVYGNRSEGFLDPYYYCAPENPLKLKKYVEQNFPFLYEYQNKDDSGSLQKLAIAYLADQARWNQAASKFLESDLDACSASYDYLFRKLAGSGEVKTARTISKKFMDGILHSGEVKKYGDQIPVIQYYMSILPSRD